MGKRKREEGKREKERKGQGLNTHLPPPSGVRPRTSKTRIQMVLCLASKVRVGE